MLEKNYFYPKWITIAEGELNQKEIPGAKNNPRILEYHKFTDLKATSEDVPWCSAFCCWCMEQALIVSPRAAGARMWLKWGIGITRPALGCVAVFKRGNSPIDAHCGFFLGEEGNDYLIIGGNQGNRVSIKKFPKKDLLGLRWI